MIIAHQGFEFNNSNLMVKSFPAEYPISISTGYVR